jgi:urease accessory protein
LHLEFKHKAATGRTVLSRCRQQMPLRVIRAFPISQGGALVHLHNLSGGVLGGDDLSLTVNVGPTAYAQLTTTSATRLYRSLPQSQPASQSLHIYVEEDGLLEYLPDPLIPFAGSRYRQQTRIELAQGAGLFWWEVVAPGRVARDERFEYEMLYLDVDILALDKPILIERSRLEPAQRKPNAPIRLGAYLYFCSFYICRVGLENTDWMRLEGDLTSLAQDLSLPGEIMWAVSTLPAHGLHVRALSCRSETLSSGLYTFWHAARLALYGHEALPPRKIY